MTTIDSTILLTGLGAVCSVFLAGLGCALGSANGGIFALRNSSKDKLSWLAFVPIVQAGVLAIYGIIVAYVLCKKISPTMAESSSNDEGIKNLSAGLSTGLASLVSGWAMSSFLNQCNESDIVSLSLSLKNGETTTPTTSAEEQREPLLSRDSSGRDDTNKKDFARKLVMVMIWLEAIGFYGFLLSMILLYFSSSTS